VAIDSVSTMVWLQEEKGEEAQGWSTAKAWCTVRPYWELSVKRIFTQT